MKRTHGIRFEDAYSEAAVIAVVPSYPALPAFYVKKVRGKPVVFGPGKFRFRAALDEQDAYGVASFLNEIYEMGYSAGRDEA